MPSSSDAPAVWMVLTGLAMTAWQLLLPSTLAGEGGAAVVVICLLWTVTAAVAVEVTTATQLLLLPLSSPPAVPFPSSAAVALVWSGTAALAVSSISGVGSWTAVAEQFCLAELSWLELTALFDGLSKWLMQPFDLASFLLDGEPTTGTQGCPRRAGPSPDPLEDEFGLWLYPIRSCQSLNFIPSAFEVINSSAGRPSLPGRIWYTFWFFQKLPFLGLGPF